MQRSVPGEGHAHPLGALCGLCGDALFSHARALLARLALLPDGCFGVCRHLLIHCLELLCEELCVHACLVEQLVQLLIALAVQSRFLGRKCLLRNSQSLRQ